MSRPVDALDVMNRAFDVLLHGERSPGTMELLETRSAFEELINAANGGRNETFGRIVFDEAQATRLRAALTRVRGAA